MNDGFEKSFHHSRHQNTKICTFWNPASSDLHFVHLKHIKVFLQIYTAATLGAPLDYKMQLMQALSDFVWILKDDFWEVCWIGFRNWLCLVQICLSIFDIFFAHLSYDFFPTYCLMIFQALVCLQKLVMLHECIFENHPVVGHGTHLSYT